MGDDVAVEKEAFHLVLAPAATERGGMKVRERGGVGWFSFGQRRLRRCEGARQPSDHWRGSVAAVCGCASGARR